LSGNIVYKILHKDLKVLRKRTNGIDGTSYQRKKIKLKMENKILRNSDTKFCNLEVENRGRK
jgi:hypothetical protein